MMKTRGIVTSEQISEYTRKHGGFLKVSDEINKELSFKGMLISCFTYGGIGRDSYNFRTYLAKYQKEMNKAIFDAIYDEMNEHFKKCEVIPCVYTDGEGCTYNSLVETF